VTEQLNLSQKLVKSAGALVGLDLKSKNHSTETYTLELLKDSTSLAICKSNIYYLGWVDQEIFLPGDKLRAIVTDQVRNGKVVLYSKNTFKNSINKFVKNLTREVISDLKVKIQKGGSEEEIIDSYDFIDKDMKMLFVNDVFKNIFKTGYIYEKVGIYIEVDKTTGYLTLNILKPFEYIKTSDSVYVMTFDMKGNPMIEKRQLSAGKLFLNDTETSFDSLMFFEISFDSDMFNSLETILAYDMTDSNIEKEIEMNKSKIYVDKGIHKSNVINNEVMNLVDVPGGVEITKDKKIGDYIYLANSNKTITEIINGKKEKEMDLVNVFGLSKKALGLESAPQDFASSLPYENDTTAKTVNEWRDFFGDELSVIFTVLTGTEIIVDLGKYALESEEAIIDVNQKAIQSRQRSISNAVAVNLNKPEDDEEVILETAKIKYENGMSLFDSENQALINAGLITENVFEQSPMIDEGSDGSIL